jgi:two-component system chemotaxis sensor kinase CheA
VECLELPADKRGRAEREGLLEVRGEPLAFYRLGQLFGVEARGATAEQIVVVRHEQSRVGLAVDALQGQRQTVIKPLGRLFRSVAGISGSTLRGDSRVALVIDVARLLRFALRQGASVRAPVSAETRAEV